MEPNKIQEDAAIALKIIADAASQATKVIADQAAVALSVSHSKTMEDHDAITEIKGEVQAIRSDIKELKDGTTDKIKDHEIRLRRLELWGFIAVGALYAIQFILKFIDR